MEAAMRHPKVELSTVPDKKFVPTDTPVKKIKISILQKKCNL